MPVIFAMWDLSCSKRSFAIMKFDSENIRSSFCDNPRIVTGYRLFFSIIVSRLFDGGYLQEKICCPMHCAYFFALLDTLVLQKIISPENLGFVSINLA